MKYLLCCDCRRAWTGTVECSCSCGSFDVIACNPWSSDGRAWYVARTKDRAADIVTTAYYREPKENRRSLLRGIRAKGNTSVRGRAA